MYEQHNKQVLDGLRAQGAGHVPYVHARTTLAIAPTAAMASRFDARAHRGTIHLYHNKKTKKQLHVEHGPADRAQFDQCIRDCGYGNWRLEYTT